MGTLQKMSPNLISQKQNISGFWLSIYLSICFEIINLHWCAVETTIPSNPVAFFFFFCVFTEGSACQMLLFGQLAPETAKSFIYS